ncbi:hypothetical protein BRC84_06475 [Halobacteriales archaeon QS_1_68_44]|nr:MAG: hypothetical protein BRC84_06475 [Halobacteriales archaeon QS_1_68_44]
MRPTAATARPPPSKVTRSLRDSSATVTALAVSLPTFSSSTVVVPEPPTCASASTLRTANRGSSSTTTVTCRVTVRVRSLVEKRLGYTRSV